MATTVILRNATPADWPDVAGLLQAHSLPLDGAGEHLQNYVLAAHGGDAIVGCAGLEHYGDIALLRSFAVAPGFEGRGIGHALFERLLQNARQRDVGQLFLLTTTAPLYFARRGFVHKPLAEAPMVLQASAELCGACPASAAFMSLTIYGPAPAHGSYGQLRQ